MLFVPHRWSADVVKLRQAARTGTPKSLAVVEYAPLAEEARAKEAWLPRTIDPGPGVESHIEHQRRTSFQTQPLSLLPSRGSCVRGDGGCVAESLGKRINAPEEQLVVVYRNRSNTEAP